MPIIFSFLQIGKAIEKFFSGVLFPETLYPFPSSSVVDVDVANRTSAIGLGRTDRPSAQFPTERRLIQEVYQTIYAQISLPREPISIPHNPSKTSSLQ